MDVYIENIKAKFGSFAYAEVKTPFNANAAEQHLYEMIPGLKAPRGRRKSIAKSDLTLKIVKTADNHLSVVKKDQMQIKESPQIKRTIDITGDGVVSRTPTPPAPISSRRKTNDVRANRGKAANRYSDGNTKFEQELPKKTYQMLRRKSMAVEKAEPKKIGAVIFKRKSIHSKFDAKGTDDEPDDSMENIEQTPSTVESTEPHKHATKVNASAKKRKPSNEQIELSKQVPEKRIKADVSKSDAKSDAQTRKMSEDEIMREENILRSVGLVKRTSPMGAPMEIPTKKRSPIIGKFNQRDRIGVIRHTRPGRKRKSNNAHSNAAKKDNSDGDKPIVLVPFLEIKEENSENGVATSNIDDSNVSTTQTTLNLSDNNTPKIHYTIISDDTPASIKTEIDSDDESLLIIEDDFTEKAKETSTPIPKPIEQTGRGSISCRDITKLTDKESSQKTASQSEKARKSFPKTVTNTVTSVLKPRSMPTSTRSTPMNNTNMVCIPLDGGLPPLDLITSTTPPPLSVVSNTNSISLLSRNQTLPSTSTEPPPLSISSIQLSSSSLINNSGNSSGNQDGASHSLSTISNGMITDQMASAITDSLIREPPKLTARPKAPLRSDGDGMFPTESGSVCQTLMENAHKMTDFFRSVIEDTLSDLASTTHPEAKIRLLELELEKQKNAHAKEIADLKANTDRLLSEMKRSMEKERARIVHDVRKQCEIERIRSIEETKRKQWCAYCGKEAQFMCCWNTPYCNSTCQGKHWYVQSIVFLTFNEINLILFFSTGINMKNTVRILRHNRKMSKIMLGSNQM